MYFDAYKLDHTQFHVAIVTVKVSQPLIISTAAHSMSASAYCIFARSLQWEETVILVWSGRAQAVLLHSN